MSNKEEPQQGIPPEWMAYLSAQGMYGFPPGNPMFNPFAQPTAATPPNPAQPDQHMQEMAKQYAKFMQQQAEQAARFNAMQAQAAQYQAMMAMAAQQGMPPQTGMPSASDSQGASQTPFENDPMMQQAQSMVDSAMGEENAGMFKELLGSLGMNDNDFWKGALVGAAAALILSNENVRGGIMNLLTGTGDMLKSGGSTVKETASSVKENVSAGGEIFRDTYKAGKEGFKDSVERHKAAKSDVPDDNDAPIVDEGANI